MRFSRSCFIFAFVETSHEFEQTHYVIDVYVCVCVCVGVRMCVASLLLSWKQEMWCLPGNTHTHTVLTHKPTHKQANKCKSLCVALF